MNFLNALCNLCVQGNQVRKNGSPLVHHGVLAIYKRTEWLFQCVPATPTAMRTPTLNFAVDVLVISGHSGKLQGRDDLQ